MEVFNIKFVGEVEKYPELYDYRMVEYSRKDCTEKAWHMVAKAVHLSARECKEKWRNIRSTFVKNQKPKPSGSGASGKKPYYLTEAMQFTLPFIKVAGTCSGNLPDVPRSEAETPHVFSEDVTKVEEATESQSEDDEAPASNRPPSVHSMAPPASPPVLPPTESPQRTTTPTGTASRGAYGRQIRRKRQRESEAADKAITEYFSAKKDKIAPSAPSQVPQVDKKEEAIKNFLMSQMPDLMQFNDVQLRDFKRRSLMLIDKLMGTASQDYQLPSYQGTDPLADTVQQSEQSADDSSIIGSYINL